MLDKLPADVLGIIFSNLSTAYRKYPVCKNIHNAIKDEPLTPLQSFLIDYDKLYKTCPVDRLTKITCNKLYDTEYIFKHKRYDIFIHQPFNLCTDITSSPCIIKHHATELYNNIIYYDSLFDNCYESNNYIVARMFIHKIKPEIANSYIFQSIYHHKHEFFEICIQCVIIDEILLKDMEKYASKWGDYLFYKRVTQHIYAAL